VAGGTCMVLWFGARMVLDGSLSTGSLIVFVLYLGRMYKPMQELSKMTDTYTKAAVAWERIQEVLQTKRDIEDLPGAVPAPPFQGGIEFDRVAFSYGPGLPVLPRRQFPASRRERWRRWWARPVPGNRPSPAWWRRFSTGWRRHAGRW